MSELATVALSVVLSFFSALLVARFNTGFQRGRDELKIATETVAKLRGLSDLYIEKYNHAYWCRESGGTKSLRDSFGPETVMGKTMGYDESVIDAVTRLHFPLCNDRLLEWNRAINEVNAFYRHFAAGGYVKEFGLEPVFKVINASVALSDAIVKEVGTRSAFRYNPLSPFRRLPQRWLPLALLTDRSSTDKS
jgi:hypothetical protein